MTEQLYNFSEGPYNLLNFDVSADDGQVVIEINGGDLGRLPIENLETIYELREALEKAEAHFKEIERRNEEL